jgi:hypothetical protein
MKGSIQHYPSNPRCTAVNYKKRSPQTILIVDVANFRIESNTTEKHPNAHYNQHNKKPDEMFVIFSADTVSDPKNIFLKLNCMSTDQL